MKHKKFKFSFCNIIPLKHNCPPHLRKEENKERNRAETPLVYPRSFAMPHAFAYFLCFGRISLSSSSRIAQSKRAAKALEPDRAHPSQAGRANCLVQQGAEKSHKASGSKRPIGFLF